MKEIPGSQVPGSNSRPEPAANTTNPSIQASKATDNVNQPANDYKKTLNDLATLYEGQVQKLEQQNSQMKGLYSAGLISRVEMEASTESTLT